MNKIFALWGVAGLSCVCAASPEAQEKSSFDLNAFAVAPVEYRAIPFWSWNEEMRPEEVRRQVALIKEGGWGGAFVHSRIGLTTEYMSEDWFKAVDATIDQCVKDGLKVFLYDEDKWPSGFAGGIVPLADESFRPKSVIARKSGGKVPEGAKPIGKPAGGLDFYLCTTPLGDPWFNGTSYIDTMNKAAVARFIEESYQKYYDRYSEHFGKAIVAEFTDEPCGLLRSRAPAGAVPFSADFPAEFRKVYGYDPIENVHKLFVDEQGAEKFRMHWALLNDKMFEENFSKQIGDWCLAHGIDFTGHYMVEGVPRRMRLWGDSVMQNYRHQGIPGVDFLGRKISERSTAKQCQSVVNQYGKKRMLCEIYGVDGGSLTFEDRQWLALQQICLGVNLINPHLSLYTMSGCRKRDYPQNIYYQQCWWPLNSALDIPLARLCYALSQGSYDTDVLVLNIMRGMAPYCKYSVDGKKVSYTKPGDFVPEAEEKIQKCETDWINALDELLESQLCFDIGDEVIMEDVAKAKNGKLRIRNGEYSVVVIPRMDSLSAKNFATLKEFKLGGGKVFKLEGAPVKLDGESAPEFEKWMDTVELVKAGELGAKVSARARKNVRIDSMKSGNKKLVWTHVRNLEDGLRLVLVVNLDRHAAFDGVLAFAGNKDGSFSRVRNLDYHSGKTSEKFAKYSSGELFADVLIPPAGAALFLLDKAKPEAADTVEKEVSSTAIGDVCALRKDENSLVLDYAAWTKSLDARTLSKGSVPVMHIQRILNAEKYDGPLTLAYTFKIDGLDKGRDIKLVMEHPERAKVLVNGKCVEYEGLPFWRDFNWLPMDISELVKEGLNQIVVAYENFEHGNLAILKPAYKRYGTEIESVYLVGDFSVKARFTGENPHSPLVEERKLPVFDCAMLIEDSIALGNPQPLKFGNVSIQGLPFYAGRLSYKFSLPEFSRAENERVKIKLDRLDTSVAEVFLDGESIGPIFCAPYEIELPESAKSGAEVEIVLYANMRNLLGPSHSPSGDTIDCGPAHFYPAAALTSTGAQLEKWLRRQWKPSNWTDNYSSTSFGDVGKISFVKTAEKLRE